MQESFQPPPAQNTISPSPLSANRIPESENGKASTGSVRSNARVPFGEMERNSNFQPCVRGTYAEMPLKFMRTNNNEMIPNDSAMGVEKENIGRYG